ncbi:hypothetical protein Sjap_019342 [Stephania japonica]|uniref:Serine-rich protein-like protein n=1 Tax=Stephania japonica TaxID=461633 RepID=A0AAP0HUM5_9MAGN
MATTASSRSRSNNRAFSSFHRSVSPSGASSSSSSGFASSSTASFSSSQSSSQFLPRPSSPTRISLSSPSPSPSPSIRFSIDRSSSPSRALSVWSRDQVLNQIKNTNSNKNNGCSNSDSSPKKTCLCSPTTHPGSFRCSLHKGMMGIGNQNLASNRLNARRSAMTNSLVRIGTVEGEWVRRALTALIRPSSHQQRRREGFRPRPTRLSVMSRAEEEEGL